MIASLRGSILVLFIQTWNVLIRGENEMASLEPKHPMHTVIVKINQTVTKNIVENFAVVG